MKDFRKALHSADEVLGNARIPRQLDAKIRFRFDETPRFAGWRTATMFAFGCMTVVLLLVVISRMPNSLSDSLPDGPEVAVGNLAVRTSPDCTSERQGQDLVVLEGSCRIAGPKRLQLDAKGPSRLREEEQGVRVVTGTVDVQVNRRQEAEPPVRTLVSGGVIEVLGTHYVVRERGTSGSVTLLSGSIRFVPTQGSPVLLTVGQTLQWPVQDSPEVEQPLEPRQDNQHGNNTAGRKTSNATAHSTAVGSATAEVATAEVDERLAHETLRQLEVLRSRGAYDEAIQALRRALRGNLRSATRERLSFELGSLLTYQKKEHEAACAHWREQLESGSERYRIEVREAMKRLGCNPER